MGRLRWLDVMSFGFIIFFWPKIAGMFIGCGKTSIHLAQEIRATRFYTKSMVSWIEEISCMVIETD